MVDTALDNLELDPPLPSPSTTSSLAMSQLQASQMQPAQEALRPADILPSIAFTVLWLFGLARVRPHLQFCFRLPAYRGRTLSFAPRLAHYPALIGSFT